MEDALISPESLSVLTGAGLIEASEDKPVYQHVVETTDDYDINEAGDVLTIHVSKEPFLPVPTANGGVENENYACVMITKDGEVISEPYVVSQMATDGGQAYDKKSGTYAKATKEADGSYKLIVKSHDCNFGKDLDCHDTESKGAYEATNLATDVPAGNGVLIDYYTPIRSGAKQIEIDAEKFAGNYYLEGSTLWKDRNGVDHPAELVIPNCKIQSAFTFTMAATGDPSTFTFTMDAFPDYTRFDKTHKVFADILVLEGETTASDANVDLHRGRSWHDGVSYTVASNGEIVDNHDN